MATINMTRLFQNIINKKNLPYCALCLRTEREVHMTTPLMIRKVLAALDQSDFQIDDICKWCEARASTVVRFLDMVDLALEVQGVLKKAQKTTSKMAKRRLLQRLQCYQSKCMEMRKATQLSNTEVLVIDALDVEGVVVGTDTLEEKERTERADELNQPPLKEIETVIIEDETPISKHPMIMPMPPQTQENPLKISSVNSMKSVEPIPSNLLNVAVGADGFLYILPSSGVPIIPQQLTVQQLETCSYTSQINSVNNGVISSAENRTMISANNGLMSSAENGTMVSINNGVISRVENRTMDSVNNRLMSSAEKRSTVPVKQKSKRPRQLEDDPSRGTSDDDVILIGDEEPEAQEQVVKYPIRIDSKVDWEDKIPIDIISFVDSKSSNVTSKVKGPKISLHKNIQTNM